MATSKVLPFPKNTAKKQKGAPEKLSQQLLQELTKDEGYRKFADTTEVYKKVGESIARVRKKKKISSAELAKRINKPEKAIHRMEKGEYKQYTLKLLLEISAALNSKLQISLDE